MYDEYDLRKDNLNKESAEKVQTVRETYHTIISKVNSHQNIYIH